MAIATCIPINAYTTLIDDNGESSAYLLCGSERALLIDTLNGRENLADIVRGLTDLPVIVVNTHGHIDHIGGNHFFSEAWMHPADAGVYREHFGMLANALREQGITPVPTGTECRLLPLEPGQIFDLGGLTLEVIAVAGHTPGSCAILDRNARLLYSGDAINGTIWMQLDHSTCLSEYLASLEALDAFRADFDGLYGGHVREAQPVTATYIDVMKRGVKEILSGDTARDDEWPWFQGMAKRHMLGADTWILYTEEKIR